MLPTSLWLLCLAAATAGAATTTTSDGTKTRTTTNDLYSNSFTTISDASAPQFTGSQYTYASLSGQITISDSSQDAASSSSLSQSTRTTKKHNSLTQIGGLPPSNSTSSASSSTSSANQPMNTVPCNNYPEFCNRKYSNITEVCAHNSAFAIPNNAGSNQEFGIIDQLNDGVRMLQGETHWVNHTIYNCHTTCKLLNAGPWQDSLELLANWIRDNPYDVVTWLIVNSDSVSVDKYVSAIQNSGIAPYLYEPQYVPQRKDQWPTLGEMIISGKRVVLFMDYNANQTAVPYILDEFTHIWETPFSPTNRTFPCTIQRPPKLENKPERARDEFMYLANHNLNTAVDLSAIAGTGSDDEVILIPNTADINTTNGEFDKFGMLGAMSDNCTRDWDRPPNFLLVDYYNYGKPKPGSVFEVAAQANGVTYNRKCCGLKPSLAPTVRTSMLTLATAAVFAILLVW